MNRLYQRGRRSRLVSSQDESRSATAEGTSEERQNGAESRVSVAVPNEDDPWSVHDVLSEMMAGWYSSGTCVEVHDYRLYNNAMSDEKANVWRVHPPDGGRAIDALNLDSFRSAGEIETYLLGDCDSK